MNRTIRMALIALMVLLSAMTAFAGGAKDGKQEKLKIAFFVSDLSNVFHQGQFTEAKKYAAEKYGAEVYAFMVRVTEPS